ncbi:MAG: ribose-5-phosphate isomerase RpiA [Methylomonas sp.]|jgi:ribose 5-phosphate isomerase A
MNDKQRVAAHAARQIENGMLVGLGTGSTANCFIEALAARQVQEGLKIRTVASSIVSAVKAEQHGLPLLALEQVGHLDVYVDGADEVSPEMYLLKGRGSDLVREKLLATGASAFWVLIESTKRVARIGQNFPIPMETPPYAWRLAQASVAEIGGQSVLRKNAGGDGLAVTSAGNLVLDAVFAPETGTELLNAQLNAIPGIIEHGIFHGLASTIFCVEAGLVSEQRAEALLISPA